jgi:hypothetical protein
MVGTSSERIRGVTYAVGRNLLVIGALSSIAVVSCTSNKSNEELNPITEGAGMGGVNTAQASAGTQTGTGNQGGGGAQTVTGVGGNAGKQNAATAGTTGQAGASGSTQSQAGKQEAGAQAGQSGAAAGQGGANAGQGGGGGVDTSPTDYGKPGPCKVVVEKGVGEKFRNNVSDDTAFCSMFIAAAAAADPNANPDVINQLTTYPADMDRGLYTLFRPETLEEGKKYPVLTWGNGTCSQPLLFEELITHVASHCFIVIATNTRQTASGVEMLRGVDFILSENENSSSALYGKVDTKMIGAFGHSQGSGATVVVGADARIVVTVPIQGASVSGVQALKGPTFLIAGEKDTMVDPAGVEQAFNAATVPAVYGLSMGNDHLMPGLNPSFIWDAVTAWFRIHLMNDTQARDMFYGDACKLCKDPRWKIQRKNM